MEDVDYRYHRALHSAARSAWRVARLQQGGSKQKCAKACLLDYYGRRGLSTDVDAGNIMKNLMIIICMVAIATGGVLLLAPHLKPTNSAFVPETPSSHVSKRLKGIFKGMNEGFSK